MWLGWQDAELRMSHLVTRRHGDALALARIQCPCTQAISPSTRDSLMACLCMNLCRLCLVWACKILPLKPSDLVTVACQDLKKEYVSALCAVLQHGDWQIHHQPWWHTCREGGGGGVAFPEVDVLAAKHDAAVVGDTPVHVLRALPVARRKHPLLIPIVYHKRCRPQARISHDTPRLQCLKGTGDGDAAKQRTANQGQAQSRQSHHHCLGSAAATGGDVGWDFVRL